MPNKTFLKTSLSALLGVAAASCWAAADTAQSQTPQVVREDVIVLNPDGEHTIAYKTLRSDTGKRQLLLGDNGVDDYYFIHPGGYQKTTRDGATLLTFDQGSYALLGKQRMNTGEITRKDGVYTYHSWGGKILANGHYGKWNAPGNFKQFAFAWLFPDNIRIVDYQANSKGKWQRGPNALVWTGDGVNDVTFTVRYRVTGSVPQAAAPAAPQPGSATAAAGNASTRITLASGGLFPSASHQITDAGKTRLAKLADKLAQRQPAQVIVEGYTDNLPLKPYLHDKYPSNWELSAERATTVVRFLIDHGVNPAVLQARAFGDQNPIADNSTATGRAKNRRIEIRIKYQDADDDTKTSAGKTAIQNGSSAATSTSPP